MARSWFCTPRAVHPYHVVVVYQGHHIEVEATDHEARHSKVMKEAGQTQLQTSVRSGTKVASCRFGRPGRESREI